MSPTKQAKSQGNKNLIIRVKSNTFCSFFKLFLLLFYTSQHYKFAELLVYMKNEEEHLKGELCFVNTKAEQSEVNELR